MSLKNSVTITSIVIISILSWSPCIAGDTYNYYGEMIPRALAEGMNEIIRRIQAGNTETAKSIADKLMKDYPDFAASHYVKSFVLEKVGEYDEALKEAEIAAKINPKSPEILHGLGALYHSTDRVPEAIETFRKFLAIAPKDNPQRQSVSDLLNVLLKETANRSSNSGIVSDSTNYLASSNKEGLQRWAKDSMPLKVYIAPGIEAGKKIKGYRSEFANILKSSFEEWSDECDNIVNFTFVSDPEAADIKCHWTADPKKLGNLAHGGLTKYNANSIEIVDGRILFLTERPDFEITDNWMRNVCLHEIGHVLGLNGHSTNPGDVMYFSGRPRLLHRPKLSERDKNTLKLLYNTKATADSPTLMEQAGASYNLGVAALQEKNYVEAIKKFEEALKIKPDFVKEEGVEENLFAARCNLALNSIDFKNKQDLENTASLLEKLIEIQQSSNANSDYLLPSLRNYRLILQKLNRTQDAEMVTRKIEKLQSSK